MSDYRPLPLREIAKQGHVGTGSATPGIHLAIEHPISLVQVMARKGAGKRVSETLASSKALRVMQAGPDQYFVQGWGKAEGALDSELKKKLGSDVSVVDQSHGRVVIIISGPKSRAVLAKGTPVDFHPSHFKHGQSAQTQMAHASVHITRIGADEFAMSVFRSFSESLWEWLCSQAEEFGCQVQ